mmetsp:Transcript_11630/g.29781  ORF Transcript_11630/g.29781 Transcript_11630/m.29781 type:complete len:325 (+) Transcript_11630:1148-2122(+)
MRFWHMAAPTLRSCQTGLRGSICLGPRSTQVYSPARGREPKSAFPACTASSNRWEAAAPPSMAPSPERCASGCCASLLRGTACICMQRVNLSSAWRTATTGLNLRLKDPRSLSRYSRRRWPGCASPSRRPWRRSVLTCAHSTPNMVPGSSKSHLPPRWALVPPTPPLHFGRQSRNSLSNGASSPRSRPSPSLWTVPAMEAISTFPCGNGDWTMKRRTLKALRLEKRHAAWTGYARRCTIPPPPMASRRLAATFLRACSRMHPHSRPFARRRHRATAGTAPGRQQSQITGRTTAWRPCVSSAATRSKTATLSCGCPPQAHARTSS